MNVVADTNVVISAIFWPGESRQCLTLWAKRRFYLAITIPVFEEYGQIAQRMASPPTKTFAISRTLLGAASQFSNSRPTRSGGLKQQVLTLCRSLAKLEP